MMKINDLIYNSEFSFNVKYRIYQYVQDEDPLIEGELILMYDSETDMEPRNFEEDIIAINQSEDGYVEIEYIWQKRE